jgi:hypothetical protein
MIKEFFDYFNLLVSKDTLFWFAALSGSGMLVIQFALNFLGIMDSESGDHGTDFDAREVKWLSKQALTGFLMMFGWIGLACKKELGLTTVFSSGFGFLGGMGALVMTGLIFKMAKKLHSPGDRFSLDDAIGKEATVYFQISKKGVGKISLSLYDLTHEVDALSLDGEDIASFTQVKIIKKADERTVFVSPVK